MLTNNSKPSKVLLSLIVLSKNNAIVAALSYFLTITLANHLGPDLFGIYSHALIVASVASIFINFGTDQTAAVLRSHYGNAGDVFNNVYYMRLAIAIPTLAILVFLYFENWEFLIFVFCLALANYNLAFLYEIRGLNERYSYIYLLERVTYVVVTFLFIYFGQLNLIYLFALLLFVTAASISYQLIDNASLLHLHTKVQPRLLHQMAKESAPLVMVALSTFAYGGFSRLILEDQLGREQLGIYSAGWQLITIGTIFQAQVSRLWRVTISDSVRALDTIKLYRAFHSYLLLSTLPMVFMCGVFIFFADRIVALLFSSSYAEVVNLLPILGIYLFVINIAGLVDMLWVALRGGSVYMLTNLIFGAILLVFLWHFAPSMGIIEFATAAVVFHFLTIISLAILWMRAFRFRLSGTRTMEC
jgi:O-antigen/teichoic acid export membrane protein